MKFYITTASGKKIEDKGVKWIYNFDQLIALCRKYKTSIVITPPERECDFNFHDEYPTLLIADDYLG